MHHHEPPPPHRADFGKIARLERALFGETYHHMAPGCDCDECVAARLEWDTALHAQTVAGWEASLGRSA